MDISPAGPLSMWLLVLGGRSRVPEGGPKAGSSPLSKQLVVLCVCAGCFDERLVLKGVQKAKLVFILETVGRRKSPLHEKPVGFKVMVLCVMSDLINHLSFWKLCYFSQLFWKVTHQVVLVARCIIHCSTKFEIVWFRHPFPIENVSTFLFYYYWKLNALLMVREVRAQGQNSVSFPRNHQKCGCMFHQYLLILFHVCLYSYVFVWLYLHLCLLGHMVMQPPCVDALYWLLFWAVSIFSAFPGVCSH